MNTKQAIIVMLLLAPSPATMHAATKNWVVGTGNWNTGGNWSPAGVPGSGDDVNIKPTDGVSRTVTYDYSGPPVALNTLGVNLNFGIAPATTTFSMAANNLTVGELDVGWSGFGGSFGSGTFTQSGGVTTVNGAGLYVGPNVGDAGTYNLSGSGSLVCSNFEVMGTNGIGTFNQTGGSNSITGAGSNLVLGFNAGATGTYTLSGGTLSVGADIVVGNGGTGTLTIQSNGSASTNGLSINSASTVNLNGGTLRFNTIGGTGGLSKLNYTAGKLQLAGSRNLSTDAMITTLYGGIDPIIPIGKELIIEGQASLNQNFRTITVDGGRFSSSTYVGEAVLATALKVINGGAATTTSNASLGQSSGTAGVADLSGPGSAWTIGGNLVVGNGSDLSRVFVRDQSLLYVGNQLSIASGSDIILEGGVLRFASAIGSSRIDFSFGTIQLAGNHIVGTTGLASAFLNAEYALITGKGLTIEGVATLVTTVTVDGGAFSAGQIVNASLLDLRRGTFNLTNQAVTIGSGGPLGSTLDVNEDTTVNVTLGITNQGLVTGDGQIGGSFANTATGELRAEAGRSLRLTGANNTNAGQISLYGGMLDFTQNITNNTGAFISGNGTLKTTTGLTNSGTMNFSGLANVVGDVTNAAGGKIISSGGGPTTFLDDVVNNGEIRTSAGSFTVFFGSVSGGGSYTGLGTVNFEGDLKPGSSPATISFAGDVVFGPDSTLQIELGGTALGTYDQLNVAGKLTLGGRLQISLINGFVPTAGQSFDLLNWGGLAGAFSSIVVPTLDGFIWDVSQLASGVLRVAVPGDFDSDGDVDGADFVAWQTNFPNASGATLAHGDADGDGDVDGADFVVWQTHFPYTPGPGTVSVPEPSALFLVLLFLPVIGCAACRTSRVD